MIKNILKGWYYKIFKKHNDLYQQRISICQKCNKREEIVKGFTICSLCGCELSAKCRVKDEHCLNGKW